MSSAPQTERLYTADDLLAMEGETGYELVDGKLVELDLGYESQIVIIRLGRYIQAYLDTNPIGDAGAEVGLAIFGSPRRLRRPDLAFTRRDRLPDGKIPTGHLTVAPDLVVEVVSTHDVAQELEIKVNEYLAAGVRLVWIVYPSSRTVIVRRPDSSALALTPNAELTGEDVLPGFAVTVGDLFPPAMEPSVEGDTP